MTVNELPPRTYGENSASRRTVIAPAAVHVIADSQSFGCREDGVDGALVGPGARAEPALRGRRRCGEAPRAGGSAASTTSWSREQQPDDHVFCASQTKSADPAAACAAGLFASDATNL